jgi:hypothetical protein
VTWTVNGITLDEGTFIDVPIAPSIQATPDGVAEFTFTHHDNTNPLDYAREIAWHTTNPPTSGTAQGYVSVDGGVPTLSADLYGGDVELQDATVSSSWDIMAISRASAGGGGGGSSTFIGLDDTPVDYAGQANKLVTVSPGEDALQFVTDYAESQPTGLIDGGELNVSTTPGNVEVTAGSGVVVDSYTNPQDPPVVTHLEWSTIDVAIVIASPTAGDFISLTIAESGGGVGTLVQRVGVVTQEQVRDEIFLGYMLYNGDAWRDISSPIVVNNTAHLANEYVNAVGGVSTIIDGGEVTEQSPFQLNQAAGTIWERNRSWHRNRKNPHREDFPALTPMQFRYTNRDFTTVGALTDTVDPTLWDNNGTVEAIGGPTNTATIQRVYRDIGDNIWILWGQNT